MLKPAYRETVVYRKGQAPVGFVPKRPTKAKKKKIEIPRSVKLAINRRITELLPRKPYALDIHKQLFQELVKSFDNRTQVRRAIRLRLFWMTRRWAYFNLTTRANFRYGIGGTRYPLERKHKKYAEEMLKKIPRPKPRKRR